MLALRQCPEISAPQPRPSAVNSTSHLSKGPRCFPVGSGNLNLKRDVFFQTGATSSYPENKIWSDNFWALPYGGELVNSAQDNGRPSSLPGCSSAGVIVALHGRR